MSQCAMRRLPHVTLASLEQFLDALPQRLQSSSAAVDPDLEWMASCGLISAALLRQDRKTADDMLTACRSRWSRSPNGVQEHAAEPLTTPDACVSHLLSKL